MPKLLVANWKLNPETEKDAVRLVRAINKRGVIICPPFVYIAAISKLLKSYKLKAELGAQDVFWEEKGAYTGEVSSVMLKNLGVKYVIIGHSERRRWLHETDVMINKKVKAALSAGLKAILCVGEPLAVRRKGLTAAKKFVGSQLEKDLASTKTYKLKAKSLVVTYEPVWAIGTGRADKPSETAEMSRFIKKLLYSKFYILNSKMLYGGSVDSQNAESFLKLKEIDGALVGGASIKAGEFKKIIKIANE